MKIQFLFQEHRLFRLINTVFLSCIIILLFGELLGIKETDVRNIAVIIGIAGAIVCLHELLLQRYLWGILGILLVIAFIMGIVGVRVSMEFVDSYLNWLINKPGWNEEWFIYYGVMQTCWVVISCYLFQFVLEKEFRIKGICAILLLGILVYYMVTGKNVSRLGVVCSIVYTFFVLIEWTQRTWEKVRGKSIRVYMNWLLPFLLVYFILLMNMPVTSKPYDWKFLKTAKAEVEEAFALLSQKMFQKDEDLEFKYSGFSQDAELGDGLFSMDKKIMVLKSTVPLKSNVYLAGKIFNTFDGKNWMPVAEMYPDAAYLDTVEMLYAVKRYDSKYSGDYIRPIYLEMCYEYLKSDYLFIPSKVWCVEKVDEKVNVTGVEGSLIFDEKQDYGTTFYINYYTTNADSDFFDVLPGMEMEPDTEQLNKILTDLETRTGVELKPEELEQYEAFCNDNYLSDIVLSKEAEDYLADVLQDADTDIEKLKAIEEELASFTYTHHPGGIPESVTDASSFLDYFLLESRQGYCTYFATAFTLLAQSQGIPARYVHGYCVPMQGNKEMTVTASMAHAWPEVYISNVGWIPFEPTPGYQRMQQVSWSKQKGSAIASEQQKKYYEMQNWTQESVDVSNGISDGSKEGINSLSATKQFQKLFRMIGRILLLLLIIGTFFVLEERIRSRYLLLKMDENKRYLFKIKQNLKLLICLDMDRKNEETLAEYRNRIKELLPADMQLQFIEDYERILYGNKQADEKMWEVLRKEQKELLKYLQERNRFRYFLFVLVL